MCEATAVLGTPSSVYPIYVDSGIWHKQGMIHVALSQLGTSFSSSVLRPMLFEPLHDSFAACPVQSIATGPVGFGPEEEAVVASLSQILPVPNKAGGPSQHLELHR